MCEGAVPLRQWNLRASKHFKSNSFRSLQSKQLGGISSRFGMLFKPQRFPLGLWLPPSRSEIQGRGDLIVEVTFVLENLI